MKDVTDVIIIITRFSYHL